MRPCWMARRADPAEDRAYLIASDIAELAREGENEEESENNDFEILNR